MLLCGGWRVGSLFPRANIIWPSTCLRGDRSLNFHILNVRRRSSVCAKCSDWFIKALSLRTDLSGLFTVGLNLYNVEG
jgi:hypothetical protein